MKPILFNTMMTHAILEGRKTVTRRVVKPKYCDSVFEMYKGTLYETSPYKPPVNNGDGTKTCFVRPYVPCKPPCLHGDVLYVRETFCKTPDGRYWYKADKMCIGCTEDGRCLPKNIPEHKTCELCEYVDGIDLVKWCPSIHMPREAARLFLRVTDVRAERLQGITYDECLCEGIAGHEIYERDAFRPVIAAKWIFAQIWDETIKKSDLPRYGWDANPWVWVIEFEKISKKEAENDEH